MRRLFVGGTLVLALAVPGPSAAAQSDESEIRSVTVEATVNRDGSMDVVETLAYDFTAERNGGFRTFEPGGADYRIVDLAVTEDGDERDLAPGFEEPNFGAQVRWFGSGDHAKVSGRHDYELTYTVLDAVDVFADTAVLNWQFIGSDFPSLEAVSIDVSFPGDGSGLRAFAHGVLHGVVEPVGNEVALRVAANPAGQFVEARILLPTANFDVDPRPEPALDRILAEEAALAQAANDAREAARQEVTRAFEDEVDDGLPGDCDGAGGELAERCDRLESLLDDARPRVGRELTVEDADLLLALRAARAAVDDEVQRRTDERNERIGNVVAPVVALAGLALAFAVWARSGRDPDRPADVGEYFRDLPTEPPAVIASLDDFGGVDSKAFAATVVDLAQRGWVTITPEGDDHRFTRTQKVEGEPLRDFEAGLLWRLFPIGRHTVTQDELTDEAKSERTVSAAWMRGFRSQIEAAYDAEQYQAKVGCLPWFLWFTIVAVVGLVAVAAVAVSAWVGATAAGLTVLCLILLAPLLRRRTEKGARKFAETQGLKKFLEDFSLVDDVPVGHLALYERYLVYAVALGVADKLIAGLRVRFPEVANDPGFAVWYGHAHVGHGLHAGNVDRLAELGSIDSFAGDLSSATAAAFSPPSSSGGSGGGFSGGSSGGGGGGGAGSW